MRMNPKTFFGELKRRNVYKVAVAYAIAGWALAQGIAQVFPVFNVPDWIVRLIVVLIVIGFPIALVFAWALEITPEGLKRAEEADAMPSSARPTNRTWIYIVVVDAAISLALFFLGRYTAGTRTTSSGGKKSIAVLPFATLSDDRNDAYFADGVQDQILTNLARVSDLKVISHTSVRQYKTGAERNMREIGKQLGVAYIMEGSVQRARDRLRINAELIDARNDSHIWAETYDRSAADLFAIQSELAQSIATQLKAKLSPQQKAEIEEKPTQDLDAFELYLQAKTIIDSYINATDVRAALLQAVKSLDEAIKRDPNFVSAYCYSARADYLFRCLRDYDRALEELAIARPGLPNSTPFFILSGYINRRRNHFPEAERDFSTAFALDPRNPNAYNLLADTYMLERRLMETVHVYDNVLAAGETAPIVQFRRTASILYATGDAGPVRDVLTKYPDMEFAGGQTPFRVWMAVVDHDYAAAEKFLANSRLKDFQDIDLSFYYPKSWYQAMIARAKGDTTRATAAFRECREILVQRLIVKPEHARTIAVLAQVDAGLGQKDLAIREAQHAIDLMPISKDSYDGALVLEGLAQVYTWSGERDHAIELVQKLVTMPGYINYGRLKLHPLWSPLRGDSRFEKIVNSLAPK